MISCWRVIWRRCVEGQNVEIDDVDGLCDPWVWPISTSLLHQPWPMYYWGIFITKNDEFEEQNWWNGRYAFYWITSVCRIHWGVCAYTENIKAYVFKILKGQQVHFLTEQFSWFLAFYKHLWPKHWTCTACFSNARELTLHSLHLYMEVLDHIYMVYGIIITKNSFW